MFATGEREQCESREGRICFFLPDSVLRRGDDHGGCRDLFRHWGGEALYRSSAGEEVRALLRTLGKPAVVVGLLDLSGGPDIYTEPNLCRVFGEALRNPKKLVVDIHYLGSLPSAQVEAVLGPADAAYRKLGRLPRQ